MTDSRVTPQAAAVDLEAIKARAEKRREGRLKPNMVTDHAYWNDGHGRAEHAPYCKCPERQLPTPDPSQSEIDMFALLAEVERLRLLCQPLQDEIDRLRAQIAAVEKLPAETPDDSGEGICQQMADIALAGYERGEVSLSVLAEMYGLPPDDMQQQVTDAGYWVAWLTPLLTEASGAAHGHLSVESMRSAICSVPEPFLCRAGLAWAISGQGAAVPVGTGNPTPDSGGSR